MDLTPMAQSPFAVVTFIAAPALLTNATTVLAMSTTQRMLRTRESMAGLLARAESPPADATEVGRVLDQIDRVEAQGRLLLGALRTIYIALGAFAGATLVTLLGAALAPAQGAAWFHVLGALGLGLGTTGVGCLIIGSVRLFRATHLSLVNIRDEADRARERYRRVQERLRSAPAPPPSVT